VNGVKETFCVDLWEGQQAKLCVCNRFFVSKLLLTFLFVVDHSCYSVFKNKHIIYFIIMKN
jgi:hypothetical protein